MRNLSDPAYLRQIMSRHGFRTSKQLGQNFIIDAGICPEIADCGVADSDMGVLEIGPGVGVLTTELARRARKVVAIELDKRLLPVLNETLAEHDNVTIINGDALRLDLNALLSEHFAGMNVAVCANLPYYITSPVLMRLLESRLDIKTITVMVQNEAAGRLCAPVPSRQAGAVTLAVRWYSEPEKLFEVPPSAFMPSPEVFSAVIRLRVRKEPPIPVKEEDMFFRVVKASFSQRRKTINNCLSSFFAMDKAKIAEILNAAGIPTQARAEQLSIEDFARLADLFSSGRLTD